MDNAPTHTPTAETRDEVLHGKEGADHEYDVELGTAQTLGEMQGKAAALLDGAGDDAEKKVRLTELKGNLDRVAGGHGQVKLRDDLGAGVLGRNKLGTKDSEMVTGQVSAAQISANFRKALDTVIHEDEVHANQDPNAKLAVVDAQGQFRDETTGFEANAVTIAEKHTGVARTDLPAKTYGEGRKLAHDIGVEVIDEHARGSKTGEFLQVEVWRGQTNLDIGRMLSEGAQVGMTQDQVIEVAKDLGKYPADAGKPDLVLAA